MPSPFPQGPVVKNTIAGIGVLAVAGLFVAFFFNAPDTELPNGPITELLPNTGSTTMQSYEASSYGLSFSYPTGYYLKARDAGAAGRPQLSIVLVEDTQENREVIEGRATTPRDGPTAITIDVYPNPDRLPAEDWVRADTNWNIRTSEAAPIGRGNITGVSYTWSGLYEGKSVIVTSGARAYSFSVTWLTPEDAILTAFEDVLSSADITP